MRENAREFFDTRMQVPTEFQKQSGLYLLRSGLNQAKPSYNVGPRMIDHYSFHFLIKGTLRLQDEHASYTLEAGTMFCLFPKVTYCYRKASDKALALCWLAFDGALAPSVVAMMGMNEQRPYAPLTWGQQMRMLHERIHQTMGQNAAFRQQSLFYELLQKLQGSAQSDAAREQSTWLEYCALYMQLHYSEALRVEALADEVGVHRSHFSTAFRKHFGQSPKQYLTAIRMAKALELVNDFQLSIQEIALTVGYPNLYTFTRAFTSYYGEAPTGYRRWMAPAEEPKSGY
jgi:AraC-like DNA-binding protein